MIFPLYHFFIIKLFNFIIFIIITVNSLLNYYYYFINRLIKSVIHHFLILTLQLNRLKKDILLLSKLQEKQKKFLV